MRDFFHRYVLKNLGLKILSLCLAVLLWWAFAHEPTVEMSVNVPVEFHHAPQNLIMTAENPFQVQVSLEGPERTLRDIRPSQVHAVLNLDGASAGERTFDITAGQIHVPREVEVVQIVPSQFHLTFDHEATRTVDVHPRVIGSLLSGYSISGVTANPNQILIVGPEKRIDAIDNAITDPVDATGVVGQATFTTHAYVADPLVRVAKPQPIHVTVTTERNPRGSRTP